MTTDTYPALRALLGGWFHQDYALEGTVPEIMAKFAASAWPEEIVAVKEDIARFLLDHSGSADTAFEGLGADILPQGWGMDAGTWLRWIASLV